MKKFALKKDLGMLAVFSIASGAMISSGLFVLPSLVYAKVGAATILAYFLAALLVLPAMFAQAELSTAMPKSGGSYFFISRSLGSLFGTFAGFANWFSLSLKSAFALLGIGIFAAPLFAAFPQVVMVKVIALVCLLFFTLLNVLSVKESGKFQIILLLCLVAILFFYIFYNLRFIDLNRYVEGPAMVLPDMLKSIGMIFVSFGGLTKIAAVAEEIKNPRRNLPGGMFSAYIVVTLLYILTIFVTIGILSAPQLAGTETPISLGAAQHLGQAGFVVLSIAAMLAFITTGNAGLLAASRNPLAMARDSLIPPFFSHISLKLKTPVVAILFTTLFMALVMIFLDLENLVKVASTMMLILFSLINVSVILMRESKIVSYKPTFKIPLYPYLNIAGVVFYLVLIVRMGMIPLLITLGFLILTLLWYFLYSKSRTTRDSALIQVVERVTSREMKTSTLNGELREILRERDDIIEDRFDEIIKAADIIDLPGTTNLEDLFTVISSSFAVKLGIPDTTVGKALKEREEISSTVIYTGLAIPHIVIEGSGQFDILVLRSKEGIRFSPEVPLVNIIFALAGSQDERNFHLQALMAIAQIVQNENFQHQWMKTKTTEDLRNLILIAQRIRKG